MKKIVLVSMLIVWTVFSGIIAAGKIFYKEPINMDAGSEVDTASLEGITLTREEVAKHSTKDNCWIIIDEFVYDVTSYLDKHPARADTITPYCGKDATEPFLTKDLSIPRDHSEYAHDLLKKYLLGKLGDTFLGGKLPEVKDVVVPEPVSSSSGGSSYNPPSGGLTLTWDEVRKHNTASNCWLVINGIVYDVTRYASHPGGNAHIDAYCGKDATYGMSNPHNHSAYGWNLLKNFYIGKIGETVTPPTTSPAPPSSTTNPEDEDEEDEEDESEEDDD